MEPNLKTVLASLVLLPLVLGRVSQRLPRGQQNGMDGGVDRKADVPRMDAIRHPDAAGGGECPLNFCGQVKVGLPSNQFPQSGADTLCGTRTCTSGPMSTATASSSTASTRPRARSRSARLLPRSGASEAVRCRPELHHGRRFSERPVLLGDVPQRRGLPERRTLHRAPGAGAEGRPHPDHRDVRSAVEDRRHPLRARGDVSRGPGLPGLRCAPSLICKTGGAKSAGAACTANAECRSGECYDRDFHVSGGQNRAFCSAVCQVNSDCGPDQGCVRLVYGNNGTIDNPLDDLVVGYCRTLFVPLTATACETDAGCVGLQNGSDTCDVAHGLCYRKAAVPGSACTRDTDSPLDGTCSMGPRFEGGYCQTFGCDPIATSGVDACPRNEQHLRPAGRPRRADLVLLREVRAGRRGLQSRERRLSVRVDRWDRAARRLSGEQRDLATMRPWIAVLAVGVVGWSASAHAQPMPPAPPPAVTAPLAGAPPAVPAPAPVPAPGPAGEVSAPPAVGPVPTADETPAASDHDAVVGHIGIEARRFDPGPMPLALRDGLGCPMGGAGTSACEVTMGALTAHYWWTRNLALTAGAAFGVGGGRNDTRGLDTYLGIGPIVGLSVLLGNWRHLAIAASPESRTSGSSRARRRHVEHEHALAARRAGRGGAPRVHRRAGLVDRLARRA